MSIINMESTLKDIRRFIVKEIISSESEWSTEGRKDYYSTKYVSIKKNFDTGLWQFNLNSGDSKFYDFESIGLNKFFLAILFIFIKRSVNKQVKVRKNDVLVQVWNNFLKSNKDIKRNDKINKIIKD
jgi:uncharacterized protein YprB with RNaseH-like and TPR domain